MRITILCVCFFVPGLGVVEADDRIEWTTSRVEGTPDPPPPFATERLFADVPLAQPTEMVRLPHSDRWVVVEVGGRIVSFSKNEERDFQVMLQMKDAVATASRAYGIVFHPNYPETPSCYIAFTMLPNDPAGTRLSKFHVDVASGRIDPASEVVMASWNSEGHSGGSLQFGPDGYLYVSVGDGQNPNPPDKLNTGQDLSDLEASILRIDVNDSSNGLPYAIPADNPFVGRAGVRGEVWAFGLRNPWKMAFHPQNGSLWTGDVGWEMREMVYRIDRGGNYGWSVTEGSQIVKSQGLPTAVPITPPIVEHTHLEARSVTGGYFWKSQRLPELDDAYIYGDWMTGKIWGLRHDGSRVTWHQELADTTLQIICFAVDDDGEVLVVGYDGTIHRFVVNTQSQASANFPKRLSETGLFTSTAEQRPAAGVVPYQINAHRFADHTTSEQWIGVPGNSQITVFDSSDWEVGQVTGHFSFPHGTVLAKTVSYRSDPDDASSSVRLETQLLHRDGDDWNAYNYIWNQEQTDAELQPNTASERELTIVDESQPNGVRRQVWHHASRDECSMCHIWSAGTVHGFKLNQLNRSVADNSQLERLNDAGIFAAPLKEVRPAYSPTDETKHLSKRARSYLHLNCAHCHRRGGGGTAAFDLVDGVPMNQLRLVDAKPTHGDFGLTNARVIAPGKPSESVLLYRLIKSGRGHMPQFGSSMIDEAGVRLIHDWIESLGEPSPQDEALATFASATPGAGAFEEAVDSLLATTSSSLALAVACGDPAIADGRKSWVADRAAKHPASEVRDLFERFLPEHRRVKRLGNQIDLEMLIAMEGDVDRGRQLYFESSGVTCRLCHQVGDRGNEVGPNLSGVGLTRTPTEILKSILDPSADVDAKYRGRIVVTSDGNAVTGVVTNETDDEITIVDAAGKPRVIARDDIEASKPFEKSLMPDMLLAEFTAEQAADLLAFLNAQKRPTEGHHLIHSIPRSQGKIVVDGRRDESAWSAAPSFTPFLFTWWKAGDGPKQPTDVKMLWDDDYLYVSFRCSDTDVRATRTDRDSDVYRDDCVEVFASPDTEHPENYFNLEINALGTLLDNYRPEGVKPKTPWNPAGIQIATKVNGTLNDDSDVDEGWTLELAIPFELFGRPSVGDSWRLNVHRLEGNMTVKSQWAPGDRNRSSFHTPEFFGTVQFRD